MADTDTMTEDQIDDAAQTEDLQSDEQEQAADDKGSKETKTLLSDDEGDGSDDVNPEDYVFTPPEGVEVNADTQSKIDQFKDAAMELGLSPEQFQSLVKYDLDRSGQLQEHLLTQYAEQINSWTDTAKADKEFGGDNLAKNLAVVKAVTEEYGDEELSAILHAPGPDNPTGMGLGSHPALLRFLSRVGASMVEGDLIESDGHKSEPSDPLKRMYPTMFNQ